MPKRNYSPEEIITKLREVEVYCKQGKTIVESCRQTVRPPCGDWGYGSDLLQMAEQVRVNVQRGSKAAQRAGKRERQTKKDGS